MFRLPCLTCGEALPSPPDANSAPPGPVCAECSGRFGSLNRGDGTWWSYRAGNLYRFYGVEFLALVRAETARVLAMAAEDKDKLFMDFRDVYFDEYLSCSGVFLQEPNVINPPVLGGGGVDRALAESVISIMTIVLRPRPSCLKTCVCTL